MQVFLPHKRVCPSRPSCCFATGLRSSLRLGKKIYHGHLFDRWVCTPRIWSQFRTPRRRTRVPKDQWEFKHFWLQIMNTANLHPQLRQLCCCTCSSEQDGWVLFNGQECRLRRFACRCLFPWSFNLPFICEGLLQYCKRLYAQKLMFKNYVWLIFNLNLSFRYLFL